MKKDTNSAQMDSINSVGSNNGCEERKNGCEETAITDCSEIDIEIINNDEILPDENGSKQREKEINDDVSATKSKSRNSSSRRCSKNDKPKPPKQMKSKKANKSKRSKEDKVDSSLECVWICTECREAECATHPDSPLLLCEGQCHRPFHYPCAGLPSLPPPDEKWICNDCKAQNHKCFICHEFGIDGEDVHKCEKGDCGLFYHLSCLTMYDVDVAEVPIITDMNIPMNGSRLNGDSAIREGNINAKYETSENYDRDDDARTMNGGLTADEVNNKPHTRPKFTCPAHKCWTCSGGPPPESPTCVPCPLPQCDENSSGEAQKSKKSNGKQTKGKAKKKDNNFGEKKDKRLFRCLECPNAYHISCIPPSCKFHELALLCPEHAKTSRLPYLDLQNSCQKDIEDRADKMVQAARGDEKGNKKDESSKRKKRMELMQGNQMNPFLPGKIFINGDGKTKRDKQINDLLVSSEEFQKAQITKQSLASFCLPCGIQDEVYSKPPVYNKISCNRIDQKHKPKRHPPTNELCQCIGKCDEHCLNRMMGVECIGDKKSPYWNCRCGPDCGNRLLLKKEVAKCRPKREQGKGWGLVTLNGVKKGELVEEYVGEVIDEKMKRKRLETWTKEHPNDPNFYIMALEPGWYIDAREKGSQSRFINHSCDPNCALLPVNVNGYSRIAIVAIQNIAPGEFLKYDYHFDTPDGDKFSCRCGAKNCRGTMKGGQTVEGDSAKKLTKTEIWTVAKAKLDRDKKFIEDVFAGESSRLLQTSATLPGEKSSSSSLVANGPDMASAAKGQRYGLYLKRNVLKGSDFSSRYKRLKKNDSL